MKRLTTHASAQCECEIIDNLSLLATLGKGVIPAPQDTATTTPSSIHAPKAQFTLLLFILNCSLSEQLHCARKAHNFTCVSKLHCPTGTTSLRSPPHTPIPADNSSAIKPPFLPRVLCFLGKGVHDSAFRIPNSALNKVPQLHFPLSTFA